VTDLMGEKIVDEHAIEAIRSQLHTVLDADER
jgi:hypothetical protein